jgi:YD repeat-containing protein
LRRYYSSHFEGLATPALSRLGNGWRTGFDAVAVWDGALASARHIHVMLPDFTEITYALEGGVWRQKDSYAWERPRTDVTATLTVSAGTVTLRQADGTRYLFNDKGRLSQIIAPDGYTQTLSYQGSLNTRVTDSRGDWIDFIYRWEGSARSGLLTSARTRDGKRFLFTYEDRSQAGRTASYPMTSDTNQWALKAVIYPDSTPSPSDNPKTIYEYLDNMYRPYLITKVTNRPGRQRSTWTTTTWTYDVKRRVTSAERTPGGERWLYVYDDAKQQVLITDNLGRATGYSRVIGADGITRLVPISPVLPSTSLNKSSRTLLNQIQGLASTQRDCSLEKDCHAYCTDKCVGVGLGSDAPFCYWKCMRDCESW